MRWLQLHPSPPADLSSNVINACKAFSGVWQNDEIRGPGNTLYRWVTNFAETTMVVYHNAGHGNLANRGAFLVAGLWHATGGPVEFQVETYSRNDLYLNGVLLTNVFHSVSDQKLRHHYYSYGGRLVAGTNLLLVHIPVLSLDHKLRIRALPPEHAIVEGRLFTPSGDPVTEPVEIELIADGKTIAQFVVTEGNYYRCAIYPVKKPTAEIAATLADKGARRGDLRLDEGMRLAVDLTLANAVSLSGQVVCLDRDRLPLAGVEVRLSANGLPTRSQLSNSKGVFQFVNLPRARYRVQCMTPGGNPDATGAEIEPGPAGGASMLVVPCPPFKDGHWQRYGSFEGLAHDSAFCVGQLSDGQLALGTEGGVSVFDGATFKTLAGSNGKYVNAISCTDDGSIWYSTSRGFVRYYKGENTLFDHAGEVKLGEAGAIQGVSNVEAWVATDQGLVLCDGKFARLIGADEGLRNPRVTALLLSRDHTLWAATSTGLHRWTGSRFVNPIEEIPEGLDLDIQAMCEGPDSNIYLALRGAVVKTDGRRCTVVVGKGVLLDPLILSIHVSPDQTIWLGGQESLMAVKDTSIVYYTQFDGLQGRNIRGIVEQPTRILWLATENGLSRLDLNFRKYDSRHGLADNRTFTLLRGLDGMLWVGTEWGGIGRFDGRQFHASLPGYYVRTFLPAPDGSVWIGTHLGALRQNGARIEPLVGTPRNWVLTSFLAENGDLWLGHGWGGGGASRVYQAQDGEYKSQSFPIGDDPAVATVYSILVEPNGRKWFGTGAGLRMQDGTNWTSFDESVMGASRVWALLRGHDGTIWIGTQAGLFRWDSRGITKCSVRMGDTKSKNPLDDHIWCIYEGRDHRLWLGTANMGVALYDGTVCTTCLLYT
ncbi:MAG: hypothetical protein N3G20_04545, partial [Verrucomicrobiae bacterium]|nr:hypothetical protein [Verrucomicrobiae bacterium]